MIERERKFLLKEEYLQDIKNLVVPKKIQQGYIHIEEGNGAHSRVRIIDDEESFYCFKKPINATDRKEIEFKIPLNEGKELYKNTYFKLEKTRYSFYHKTYSIDVDIYEKGLKIVEIEFENEFSEIPYFCGKEVTGVKKYSNIFIAISNNKID